MTALDPRDPAGPLSPPPPGATAGADPVQYAQAETQRIADANRRAIDEAEVWADSHVMPWRTRQ